MSSPAPSSPIPLRSLEDLLRPLEAGGTGLVAVTLSDGRVAELWVDDGRLSHATCAGVEPLAARLGVERVDAGGDFVAELVCSGVDPDAIRDALGDLALDILAEFDTTGIAGVQAAQADHPYRGVARAIDEDDPDEGPRTDADAPPLFARPAPGSAGPLDAGGDSTSAALQHLIEGVRDL
jgi:hypothetical protein